MKINEVGNQYGRLLVLCRANSRKKGAYWFCSCDCGNSTIVRGKYLRNGTTASCGCLIQEKAKVTGSLTGSEALKTFRKANPHFTGNPKKEEAGKRYGNLYVVSIAVSPHGRRGAYWNCECDCGSMTIVSGYSLRKGLTASCGCKQQLGLKQNLNRSKNR